METQTLAAERARASFDVRRMAALWLGGDEQVAAKEKAVARISEYSVYDRKDIWRNNKYERYIRSIEKTTFFWQQQRSGDLRDLNRRELGFFAGLTQQDSSVSIHESMFKNTIRLQASDEQRKLWMPAVEACAILGTYCQTEIGHGSDVAGLETTATYDHATQEFDIHTPSVNATKWWPQGLGRTVTHAVVYARLRLPRGDGSVEDKGPKAFLVQLRDLNTHVNLPGIRSGDIGPTVGVVDAEQGWAIFDHVRVPRAALLSRYGEVSETGKWVSKGAAGTEKRGYSTMMLIRASFVMQSSDWLSKACAIALRYCAVRRQFPKADSAGEDCQVLDYQGVQARTLPWLAAAYALRFTGRRMMTVYNDAERKVEADGDTSQVAEAHALSSGLKACTTKCACDGIEELRRACGGHGYLHFSGLGEIYGNAMLTFTGEGENYMIIQQLSRWLLKGHFGNGWAAFLGREGASRCEISKASDWRHPEFLVAALQHRARRRLRGIQEDQQRLLKMGQTGTQAAQGVQWAGIEASFAVCEALMAQAFFEDIESSEASLKPVLTRLCNLFCLQRLEHNLADLLLDVFVTPQQAAWLRQEARELLIELRPDAIALVDAFSFSDNELNSAIGAYDGDVYNRLLDWASKEPMNAGPVIQGWREHFQPVLTAARHQLQSSSGLNLRDRGLEQHPSPSGAAPTAPPSRL